MVNREQEVMDRVHSERGTVTTEPLRDVFTIDPFEESMLNNTDDVFDIETVGHHAHPSDGGGLVTAYRWE